MGKGLNLEFEPGSIRANINKAQADKIDELRALLAGRPAPTLDVRTQLAGYILAGLLSQKGPCEGCGEDCGPVSFQECSESAVAYADALIRALSETGGVGK